MFQNRIGSFLNEMYILEFSRSLASFKLKIFQSRLSLI